MGSGDERGPESSAAPAGTGPPEVAGAPVSYWEPPKHPSKPGTRMKRIVVGGVVLFVSISALYGPASAGQMLALAVVCTVGIGLIPILFVCWLVGWIALEVWAAVSSRLNKSSAT